jgi:hypothetical protein
MKPFLRQSTFPLGPPSPFIGQTTHTLGQPIPFLGQTTPFLGQTTTTTYPSPISQITPGIPNTPNTQNSYIHTPPSSGQFQLLTPHNNMSQTQIPPNPFLHQQPQSPKRPHEGRYRGRRRGFS